MKVKTRRPSTRLVPTLRVPTSVLAKLLLFSLIGSVPAVCFAVTAELSARPFVPSLSRDTNGVKKKFSSHVIILDPGHGGVYSGQVSNSGKLIEKNVALDIAKRAAKLLRDRGFTVILTRTKDTELDKKNLLHDLALRANMAQTYKADVFVSLHLNGSKNRWIRGYEVYVPYETKYPIRSYKLANSLHYELSHGIKPVFGGGSLGNLNNIDHGIKASKFNVLVKSHCPTVLVELDYLTNPESEKMLLTEVYRDTLANTVSRGIRRYFIKAKPVKK